MELGRLLLEVVLRRCHDEFSLRRRGYGPEQDDTPLGCDTMKVILAAQRRK